MLMEIIPDCILLDEDENNKYYVVEDEMNEIPLMVILEK